MTPKIEAINTRDKNTFYIADIINNNTKGQDSIDRDHLMDRSSNQDQSSDGVFIVHGRDYPILDQVARFLGKHGLKAIMLKDQPNEGLTIIEKLEKIPDKVNYAIALLTPDDVGGLASLNKNCISPRARQNVIFEIGYFFGHLGRKRVCMLLYQGVEMPSDLHGLAYVKLDDENTWENELLTELKQAKIVRA
jgi:predicted nucleotide-binding protein